MAAAAARPYTLLLPLLLLLLLPALSCSSGRPVHPRPHQPPPPPSRQLTQSLSGPTWTLRSSNGSIHCPATVPGGAYTDLLHSRIIPDPYFRFHEDAIRWVAQTDWHYSNTFTPHPTLLTFPHVELVFDGIDTVATILLDDRPLLSADNMSRRWVVDVTEALRQGGEEHRLEVRLGSAVAYAAKLNASYPYPLPRADPASVHPLGERQMVRKSQVDWGWNNQPALGDVGIHRDVALVAFHTAIIRDVVATQLHADALTPTDRSAQGMRAGDVQLNVTAYIRVAPRRSSPPSSGVIQACVAGMCVNSSTIDLIASLDQSGDALLPLSAILVVPAPALWWPQTMGNATLHPLHLTLLSSLTQVEHSLTRRIGFRYLFVRRSPTPPTPGLTFRFEVNGVGMFVKGTNVVPLDSFHSRVTEEWRARLVESLRLSRLNVVRVSAHPPCIYFERLVLTLGMRLSTSADLFWPCARRFVVLCTQVGRWHRAAGRLVRPAGRGGDHLLAGGSVRVLDVPYVVVVAGRGEGGDRADGAPPVHPRIRPAVRRQQRKRRGPPSPHPTHPSSHPTLLSPLQPLPFLLCPV